MTGMSKNTVRKYIRSLADKDLISTESTTAFTRDGMKRNGTLLYTIHDLRPAADARYRNLLNQLETANAERSTSQTAPV